MQSRSFPICLAVCSILTVSAGRSQWIARRGAPEFQRNHRRCASPCVEAVPCVSLNKGGDTTKLPTGDYDIKIETKFETARCYYLKIAETELEDRQIPDILINRVRKKGYMECQTLLLLQLNQKIEAAQQEVILKSDDTILGLLDSIRGEASSLYRICESVALLDMIAGLVQLATTSEDYVRPDIDDTLAIKAARHPVKEKVL